MHTQTNQAKVLLRVCYIPLPHELPLTQFVARIWTRISNPTHANMVIVTKTAGAFGSLPMLAFSDMNVRCMDYTTTA